LNGHRDDAALRRHIDASVREAIQPVLRHLVELRRGLGQTELHVAPRYTRRRPLG